MGQLYACTEEECQSKEIDQSNTWIEVKLRLSNSREINKIGSENNSFFNKSVRDMAWSHVITAKLTKNRNSIAPFEANFAGLIDRSDLAKKH